MNFWQGFWSLPIWFTMLWLSAGMVGIFTVIYELANRKLSITKAGVTFDRLKPKKDGFWFWRREDKKKTPLEDA